MRVLNRLLGVGALVVLSAAVPVSPKAASGASAMMACSSGSGNISPCTQSVSTAPNTSGLHQTFTINNTSGNYVEGGVSCAFTAPVTSCSLDLTDYALNGHTSQNEVVTFAVGATPGTGTVTVTTGGLIGTLIGTVNVTSASPEAVTVTPDNQAVTSVGLQQNSYVFTVKNTGTLSLTYDLTASCTGTATSCAVTAPTQITLAAGAQASATETYTAGAVGTASGTVKLTATSTSPSHVTDYGTIVETSGKSVATTPDGSPPVSGPPLTPSDQVFKVTNSRSASTVYNLTIACTGALTGCWTPATVTVGANTFANVVTSYYTGANNTTGTITLTAKQSGDLNNTDNGYVNVTATTGGGGGCGQDRVGGTTGPKGKKRIREAPVNCFAPPQIIATPVTSSTSSKTVTALVQYCSIDTNMDAGSIVVMWNGVNVTSLMDPMVPDTMPTSGFCGATKSGPHTGRSIGTLTLKPGPNTLSSTACTDGYGVCATGTWTYTYVPIFPVAVTPDDSAVRVFASTASTLTYKVKRLDADTVLATYNISKSCTGAAFPGGTCAVPATVSLRGRDSAFVALTWTSPAAIATGRAVLTATLASNAEMVDSGSMNVNSSPPGVAITPDNVAQNAAPSAPNTAFFTVTNTGPVAATFNFNTTYPPLCAGTATSCVVTPTSQSIAGGASFTASIRYNAGALTTTGRVRFGGIQSNNAAVLDTGWVNITVATPASVVVADAGTGSTRERSLCLTVAAGHGAAAECGDLRLAQALPGVRTKNKARTPTLIYNSAHAHPYPTFPFVLTLPAASPVPDSVTASLIVGGVTRAVGNWNGADFNFARTRRGVLAFDALADTTNVYTYSVQAKSWYGNTNYSATVVNGEYSLVNRRSSNFGAGWWMAGLEQLVILADGSLLWMDGDGSTRHYTSAGTNVWAAPKVTRPDSIKLATGYYTRFSEHGLRVVFDNTGNHVYTVNRISDTTKFTYTGRRLDNILVAPMSAGKTFVFSYDAGSPNQRLATVTSPTVPGHTRITTITTSGGRVTAIRDPDLTQVAFGYVAGDTNRIVSRTDRRGTVGSFVYNAAKKLIRDSVDMQTTGAPIVMNFRPHETVGISPTSVDTARAYGLIDGPRTDVADTVIFWLDNFGAPRKILNALGAAISKVDRTDPNFPALATRIVGPSGAISRATYDARGNVLTSTDSSTCIAGACATTTYEWDSKWDYVTRIVAPLGEVTRIAYDAINGNRLWQQPDDNINNTTRRITYTYDITTKLVATVQQPVIAKPDSIWYDGAANTDSTKSPSGVARYFFKDALGRDTLSVAPLNLRARVAYDIADRDSLSQTFSPGAPDIITVTKTFDAEGNVLTHNTTVVPDSNHLGTLSHIFTYDRANRKLTEQPQGPNNGSDAFTYDAAGNVVFSLPRSSAGITTQYDVLNRAILRVVPAMAAGLANYTFGANFPADTQTFVFDSVGRLVQANNLYARVRRTWNQNGTMAADSIRMRASIADDPSFPNRYGLRFGYDLEGRRLWMKAPGAIAPLGSDSTAYSYDATTGLLRSERDLYGNRFAFGYDNDLRLVADTGLAGAAAPTIETTAYDDESRVVGHTLLRGASQLLNDAITYDQRGRITSATYAAGGGSGMGAMRYAAIGPLVSSADNGTFFNDSIVTDALGNARTKIHYGSTVKFTWSTYDPGTGILLRTLTANPGGGTPGDSTIYSYNLAGSVWSTIAWHFAYIGGQNHFPYDTTYSRVTTSSRYGADNMLMMTQTHFDSMDRFPGVNWGPTTYYEREEYRYDALGRRIWRRLVRPSKLCPLMNKASGCLSVVERTIWDGDQVLAEIRRDGGEASPASSMDCDGSCQVSRPTLEGTVLYTNGAGVDHPLDVVSLGWYSDVIIPVYNWRGRTVDGVCVNGSQFCSQFAWPARTEGAFFNAPDDPPITDPVYGGPPAWAGNVLDTQQDGSGQIYKRNRYYDPTTGRFTQVDPIGLGGGLNAYGFTSGDPINFTDAFGTCKIELKTNAISGAAGKTFKKNHAYIVVTEADNTKTVFRAGPTGGVGSSPVSQHGSGAASKGSESNSNSSNSSSPGAGPEAGKDDTKLRADEEKGDGSETDTDAPSEDTPETSSATIVNDDKPCKLYEDRIRNVMKVMNGANLPYNAFNENSNTAAHEFLKAIGKPDAKPSVSVPGWNSKLY